MSYSIQRVVYYTPTAHKMSNGFQLFFFLWVVEAATSRLKLGPVAASGGGGGSRL